MSWKLIIFVVTVFILGACSPFRSSQSSTVLILIDAFAEKDYLCSESRVIEDLSALEAECKNFIRFTHSFTPTQQLQASLATLFSGEEMRKHELVHNGATGLSNRFETVAERALAHRLRTGLISGGLPLLPKAGLTQGFEFYNDSFTQRPFSHFRPVDKSIDKALLWLDDEVRQKGFFLTIYVPDLLHREHITHDDQNDERAASRSAQVLEISESINYFIAQLKKRKLWHNLNFIVMGVSGERHDWGNKNKLNSDSMQVPLQIKLAESKSIKIDAVKSHLVSFSYLGYWLKNLVSPFATQESLEMKDLSKDQFIAQRSDHEHWLGLDSQPVLGVRQKQYLFRLSPELQAFDSFNDKIEKTPLAAEKVAYLAEELKLGKKMRENFSKQCFEASQSGSLIKLCRKVSPVQLNLADIKTLQRLQNQQSRTLDQNHVLQDLLTKRQTLSVKLAGWYAYQLMVQKQWVPLFELGNQYNKPAWTYLAQANLRENHAGDAKGCLQFFKLENRPTSHFYRNCNDFSLRQIIDGLNLLREKRTPSRSFWERVGEIKTQRIARTINLKMKFINHVEDPFEFGPTLSELFFYLPENIRFINLIDTNTT